jgi:molybdopterin converting factor small subunit
MRIRINLEATIAARLFGDRAAAPEAIDAPDGTTVADVLARFDLDGREAKVVFVNRKREKDRARTLRDGDELAVFPLLGGG